MRNQVNRSSFFRRSFSVSVACAVGLLVAGSAHAQTGTNTGGTGNTGTDTGTAGTNFAAPTLLSVGQSIDATGGTGFAGAGNAAQNFVGGGLQSAQGQTGAAANNTGRATQFGNQNRGQTNFGRGRQPTGPSRASLVRPRYRFLGYSPSPERFTTISTNLQTRMSSPSSLIPGISGVQVSLDNQGNVTLTGTVDSEHSAQIAAALARIEPGVRSVDNQLQVNAAN